MKDDAGSEVFEGGCYPYSTPAGGNLVGCAHLVNCLGVVACDGPAFIIVGTPLSQNASPPGSFQANVRYAPTTFASEHDYSGTITVSDVIDGSLGGTFTTTGPSGTFCVQWQ